MDQKIKELREQIDEIDDELLSLLHNRIEIARQIGKRKSELEKEQTVYLSPERQIEILQRIKEHAKSDVPAEGLIAVFTEIMSLCLNAESTTRVVYLGPPGTYTQQAAIKFFGNSSELESVQSIPEVFREVEAKNAPYGVVPIENSSEGMVSNTMDVLLNSSLYIVGEIKMAVHHCLLAHPWAKSLKDIAIVFSHQQSIAQCRLWLSEKLPDIEIHTENSNARAAQQTVRTPNSAAIASELNAEIYNLNVLARNIEDQPDNTTRFLVIGKQKTLPTNNDKTSLVLAAKNEPGSLYRLLECFYTNEVDLTLLESRPTPIKNWQYYFFIDCRGHQDDDKIRSTLALLEQRSSFLKVLGSYPASP